MPDRDDTINRPFDPADIPGFAEGADEHRRTEWECGSCGAFIDAAIADPGDDYHDPDEDCRAVRVLTVESRIAARLDYLRGEIEAESISYGEIAELQDLAAYIDPSDVVLLQWAGVPEGEARALAGDR